ncbi:MAG: iron-containing alcohol dehydrogenase, partial [Candidatus Latescibacteria bacterium]|nr:iron-containing alcohol dehydrogenase [Candidatus Latescibacterota bacterium]
MHYDFHVPTAIRFGEDSIRLLPQLEDVRGKRCLLLTYPGFDDPDLIAALHVSSSFFVRSDAFEENPSHGLVRALGQHVVADEIETIIAIGGGSTIDSAKGASWFAANPHYGEDGAEGPLTDPTAKIVAAPTTAGTGSEVSPFVVLTDSAHHRKTSVKHMGLAPSVALCDPALTVSMPRSVTADTGIDAVSHAVEAYLSSLCHGFLDDLSVGVFRTVH